jgi:hypothetical protein
MFLDSTPFVNKPKVIVRYPGGASGHFLCTLLLLLTKEIKIFEFHRAHKQINMINQGHNFNYIQFTDQFKFHTATTADINNGIKFVRNNIKFTATNNLLYTIHTHIGNPDVLPLAFDNSRLINIYVEDSDRDQLSYNWIVKSCMLHEQWDNIKNLLVNLQSQHREFLNIDPSDIGPNTDLKLLCNIYKKGKWSLTKLHTAPIITDQYPVFNIFFKDIRSKQIMKQLDDLIDFIGIPIDADGRIRAVDYIARYAKAQSFVTIPFALD